MGKSEFAQHEESAQGEERLLALMKATTDVMYSMSPDWKTMTQLYGHGFLPDMKEPNLKWLDEYIHPDDQPLMRSAIDECVREKKTFDLEHRVLKADGNVGWIHSRAVPVLDENGEIIEWFGAASDITGSKKMDEALRDSEAKYRTIVETAQEGIWVINGNDQTTLVNERLRQMLGYSLDELMGQSPQAFMAPEFQAAANERLAEHMEGISHVIDYRFIKKDGSSLWCILSSTPLFNRDGKFDGSIAMITDITERKQTEEELQRYTAWHKAILDLIPAGVWISDHTGTVITVNQEAVNMYRGSSPLAGSPEEYTTYKLFLPGTDEPVAFEPYVPKEALTGVVLNFARFDGTRGTLVASTQALRDEDGNVINYVATAMDISPLRQAEVALQESEKNALNLVEELNQTKSELTDALHLAEQKSAEWNAIVDAVPDGITVYGKKGDILYMNDAVRDLIESYDESVKSSFEKRMEVIHSRHLNGDEIDLKQTNLYIALNNGEITKDSVVETKLRSGRTMYSSHSCAPIRGRTGEIVGAVMIHKDVTESVELRKQTDELVTKLRETDRNRNAFLNVLSHELRNPLASIVASLDLLEKAPLGGIQAATALGIAKRQAKQLGHLVDDLLDVTRITHSRIELRKEKTDLNELVKKAVQDYQPLLIENGTRLELTLTSPLYLEADPYRLTQIIGNLLHNAAKVTTSTDQVIVTVSQDTNTKEAVITVEDTGRGIAPEVLGNLLEPFTQTDQSSDRKGGGLGLGLAIVRGMVELHGGKVKAFSEGIGKGATFTISLPLPEGQMAEQERRDRTDDTPGKSLTVVMIEDNKDLAEAMCELIGLLDHKAAIAHDGATGIALAMEVRPDVIMCDIGLPGMSGHEVAKKIREDSQLRGTYLIAVSGYTQPEDIARAERAGFDRYLSKPVDLATLDRVLREVR